MATRGVEALFIPGQQLSLEAETLIHQVRNCGARLNRLKLARAAPDAPMWWQFLSSADGSAESLDRAAYELHAVLRDLEQANAELKRLCVAPASDVAGNVQREMEKKRWAISTLDRWGKVLKTATVRRAEVEATKPKPSASSNNTNNKNTAKKPDGTKRGGVGAAAAAADADGGPPPNDNSSTGTAAPLDGSGTLHNLASLNKNAEFTAEERRQQAILQMAPRRQQLIKQVLDAQHRVEKLRDDLDDTESEYNSALKLAAKFRELEQLEQRFANLNLRRRQFRDQAQAHLLGIGAEIEREASARLARAQQYYDEHHPRSKNRKKELAVAGDESNPVASLLSAESNADGGEEEDGGTKQQQQHQATTGSPLRRKRGKRTAVIKKFDASGNDNNTTQDNDDDEINPDDEDADFYCDECQQVHKQLRDLEKVRRAKWVNRAVRVLSTQAVAPQQLRADAHRIVPSQRFLALVGSRISDGQPVCVQPLFTKKQQQQQQAAELRGGDSIAVSGDRRDVVWQVPSAHDHAKFWTVHLHV